MSTALAYAQATWLTPDIAALTATAATVGLVHTLLGPDHYLPFVALSRSNGWSLARTTAVTAACGVGHVLGSILLGLLGLLLGTALSRLEWIESVRGAFAAWMLLAFGLAYLVYGLRHAARGRRHSHLHVHAEGTVHRHEHDHRTAHAHVHAEGGRSTLAPWALFLVFVLGPCEVLVPLLMVPAAAENYAGLTLVVAVFAVVTIATMVGVVALATLGLARFRLGRLEPYTHALAGGLVTLCGVGMVLGW